MLRTDCFNDFWIWEHSQKVRDLYTARARGEAEEMTCAAQAAELLKPLVTPGDVLLDAGCGSGSFYLSLVRRQIPVDYWGVDAARSLVEIGKRELPSAGLDPQQLLVGRIEDLGGEVDHVVCLNVLTNIDNYHRPLERLLLMAGKTVILRESCGETSRYEYVHDPFLDPGVFLKVHVNTYSRSELARFIESYGYEAEFVIDRRTGGEPEMVIGYPHRWTFVVARRKARTGPADRAPGTAQP